MHSFRSFRNVGVLLLLSPILLFGVNRASSERNEYPSYVEQWDDAKSDLFHGKHDAIYLNGWWKLAKLKGTESNPPEDEGTKKGYFREDVDDSQWDEAFVPWNWNRGKDWNIKDQFRGVGWYRRSFSIPESYQGRRLILHFDGVLSEATVFINGLRVGKHRMYPFSTFLTEFGEFTMDITDFVQFGRENTLAVRVYHYTENLWVSGIWQPVRIDVVPKLFAERILVTPQPDASSIQLTCWFNNGLGKDTTIPLLVELQGWKSDRYRSPDEIPVTEHDLGMIRIPKGVSCKTFTIPLAHPVYWTYERPNLYHLSLLDGKEIIGQTRFGYRRVTIDGVHFRLNGKKLWIAAEQLCNETSAHRPNFWSANQDLDKKTALEFAGSPINLTEWLLHYKYYNLNMLRAHSDSWTKPMFDLADEIGMMVYPEIPHVEKDAALGHDVGGGTVFDVYNKQGQLPREYKNQLANRIYAHWNHPSIWAYSLGNEMYEGKYTPFLCDAYEYVKNELHAPWPISQSGRYFNQCEGDPFTKKVDFFDDHYYWLWVQSWPQMERYNSHLDRYIDGRLDRPWFNGECFGMFPNSNYDMFFKTLRTDLPDIPRDKYASLLNRTEADFSGQWRKLYWSKARSNLRLYGIRGFLLETEQGDPMRGEYYKRLVETHRRWNQYITGFATHRMRPPRQDEITAFGEMVRQVNNPLYACTDLYFRHHFFAGRNFTTNLFTFNDTLEDARDVAVHLRIVDKNGKIQYKDVVSFPLLKQGEKNEKQITWPIPPSQKTGHYTVELSLRRQGKEVVSNKYNIYILGNDARRTEIKSNQRIALYLPAESRNAGEKHAAIKNVLDRLAVRYDAIRGAQSLSKYDILILGPDSFDETLKSAADAIRRWVNQGGKLLCLEQTEHIGPIPFAREMRLGETLASRVDVIVPQHPVFDGLNADDWDMWDGTGNILSRKDLGNVFCQRDIQPVSDIVLATSAHHDAFGMALAEVRVGRGVIFFSQVEATGRYDEDSVATRYLENLLQYTLAESWPEVSIPKYTIPQLRGKPIPSYTITAIPPNKALHVNLRDVANRGFADDQGQDGKGGWFDEGASQDLRLLPVGKQTFADVPFDIIDPNTNTGRSCVVLHTKNGRYAKGNRPEQVEIPVGRHVKRLVFLVAGAWVPSPPDHSTIGEIVVTFGGGKCLYGVEVIPLRCNINIGNWWLTSEPLPGAQVAWSARDPRIPNTIGLWMFEWTNRQEESEIEKIIFRTRHKQGIPALVAVTGEISTWDPKAATKK